MSLAEDLLNSLPYEPVATFGLNPETEPHIVINLDRTVAVPESLRHIAVEGDHNIETVTFDCPRYWDSHDLSQMRLRIVFQRPDGHREPHLAENVRVDPDDVNVIHFDWTISNNVTLVRGNISFTVCAKLTNAEGVSEREWHTRLNQDLIVDEGMDCSGDEIVEQNPDIIEAILVQLEELQNAGGNGSSSNSGQNAALTATERNTLIAVVNAIGTFNVPNGRELIDAFNSAWGGSGSEAPEQPEKTLTGITAAYSGGSVPVGTAVSALTGITVTASYSDGSTGTVTGYTLSGTIGEGSNTVTATYQGKTATFIVTGVTESGGGEDVTALKGIQLPVVPTNWTSNEDWQFAGNSGNLYSLIGTRWLYLDRVFTGTLYVRTVSKTPYSYYAVGMTLVAEDYLTNQTAEGTELTASNKKFKFNEKFLYVSADGTNYEYLTEESSGGYYVRLQKFDIPEGQCAILHMANPSATGTINIDGGWTTVFFEDPTDHITVTEVYE